MAHGGDETTPVWAKGAPFSEPLPHLIEDARCDVCVVGAGIAGLSTAYHLSRAGHRVVVVESGPGPALGETGRSTCHLVSAVDDRFTELERLFGPEGSRLVAQSHAAAVDSIEAIAAAEAIACDFRRLDGWLFNAPNNVFDLNAEAEAAQRAGLDASVAERAPIAGFDTGPAIRFRLQGRADPYAYALGLAAAAMRHGARIFGGAQAMSVAGGYPARVSTAQGWHVLADAVVVATNVPINDRFAIHNKLAPFRTYAVALECGLEIIEDALYWDTADPYHYVRLGKACDGAPILVAGGEDHPVGSPAHGADRWSRLEEWTRARFSGLGIVRARWSGQVMEPADRIAFIGRNPMDMDNVFIASGDSGNGMTFGALAGLLLTDMALGRANAWERLYDPARVTLRAAPSYADAGLHVAEHYAEWLTGGDVANMAQIAVDGGAVLRHGLSKMAVYRDEAGTVHKHSAVCPHLKCIVAWNDAEKSWDCPCHGSRFDRFGRVVNGPANESLGPVEE